jgi:hypothetical protein
MGFRGLGFYHVVASILWTRVARRLAVMCVQHHLEVFRVQGSGFRVQGLKVQGLGSRV